MDGDGRNPFSHRGRIGAGEKEAEGPARRLDVDERPGFDVGKLIIGPGGAAGCAARTGPIFTAVTFGDRFAMRFDG
jgi:hypothetical protein